MGTASELSVLSLVRGVNFFGRSMRMRRRKGRDSESLPACCLVCCVCSCFFLMHPLALPLVDYELNSY